MNMQPGATGFIDMGVCGRITNPHFPTNDYGPVSLKSCAAFVKLNAWAELK